MIEIRLDADSGWRNASAVQRALNQTDHLPITYQVKVSSRQVSGVDLAWNALSDAASETIPCCRGTREGEMPREVWMLSRQGSQFIRQACMRFFTKAGVKGYRARFSLGQCLLRISEEGPDTDTRRNQKDAVGISPNLVLYRRMEWSVKVDSIVCLQQRGGTSSVRRKRYGRDARIIVSHHCILIARAVARTQCRYLRLHCGSDRSAYQQDTTRTITSKADEKRTTDTAARPAADLPLRFDRPGSTAFRAGSFDS